MEEIPKLLQRNYQIK